MIKLFLVAWFSFLTLKPASSIWYSVDTVRNTVTLNYKEGEKIPQGIIKQDSITYRECEPLKWVFGDAHCYSIPSCVSGVSFDDESLKKEGKLELVSKKFIRNIQIKRTDTELNYLKWHVDTVLKPKYKDVEDSSLGYVILANKLVGLDTVYTNVSDIDSIRLIQIEYSKPDTSFYWIISRDTSNDNYESFKWRKK